MKPFNSMNDVAAVSRAMALGSTFALLGGCVLDPISIITDPIMYAAAAAGPTEAEYKAQHDADMKNVFINQYRGETCAQITAFWPERMASVARDPNSWGGRPALEAAQQVIGEKGCAVPQAMATADPASPAAAPVERDPASFAAVLANPSPEWGSVSSTGLPQTSLAGWIAQETPARYQNRSCDYLNQALVYSRAMEDFTTPEAQAWGAYKRVAVRKVFDSRDCPAWNGNGAGRIGASVSGMDPVKASRLNMPAQGASVQSVLPGGNAERAGLKFADVVVSVDATAVTDAEEFLVAIGKLDTGSTAMLKVWRGNGFIDVPVQVGPRKPSTVPAHGTASRAQPAASPQLLDMQLASLSPDYAKAVGLVDAKGAWVVETSKGGQAERAGLKALDVILEVSGQEIASPDDFAAVASKTRKGYNASVVVWRDQGRKELKLVLNGG